MLMTTKDSNPHRSSASHDDDASVEMDSIDYLIDPASRQKQIDRYVIEKVLGDGGMGKVFLAWDQKLKRPVALKVLLPAIADEDIARERFRREAEYMATLCHPGICPVFDYGEWRSVFYIAMQYLDGVPLSQLLARQGAQTPFIAVQYVRQLADALRHAHQRDVLHRDLKPSNIILCGSSAVLTDFGMARRIEEHEQITESDEPIGTLTYMPIEQFRADHDAVGPHSDVYSLGAIFFEMLTGQPPFTGDWADVMKQLVKAPCPRAKELIPDLDPELDALCSCMFAKEPEDRMASMNEVVSRIDAWMEGPSRSIEAVVPPKLTEDGVTVTELRIGHRKSALMVEGQAFLIGRDARRNDLCIDHPDISRTHAVIVSNESAGPSVVDLKSRTGLRQGKQRVHVAKLEKEGSFRLGTIRVQYQSSRWRERSKKLLLGPIVGNSGRTTFSRGLWKRRQNVEVGVTIARHDFVHSQGGLRELFHHVKSGTCRLRHPNLIRTYRVIEDDGEILMIQKWPRLGTLSMRRKAGESFTLESIIRMGHELGAALDFCESQRIVHGAISPETIQFDRRGTALLGELTLPSMQSSYARATDDFSSNSLMSSGVAAPETATDPPRCDLHSDLYSLAATLHSLLAELNREIPSDEACDLITRDKAASFMRGMDEVLQRSLESDPALRFPSMLAFRQAWTLATSPSPA
ncbi:MAG: protein kinase [Planctomycetaceae bacterium]|nr:protein kinase [Planctomycetaceae bacterium]